MTIYLLFEKVPNSHDKLVFDKYFTEEQAFEIIYNDSVHSVDIIFNNIHKKRFQCSNPREVFGRSTNLKDKSILYFRKVTSINE